MDTRIYNGITHLSKAYTINNKICNIYIRIANSDIIDYWCAVIQPEINKDQTRADCNWNWKLFTTFHSRIGKLLNQKPKFFTIGVIKNISDFIPLSLIMVTEKYPYLINKQEQSSFIWYMSTAPKKIYDTILQGDDVLKLGLHCIDVGITSSYNNFNFGRIGLHAAPKGGSRLMAFYEDKCKLKKLNKNVNISVIRQNDGRYFYSDIENSLAISKKNDDLR